MRIGERPDWIGSIGWWGIPGGPVNRNTKVHLRLRSRGLGPACGSRLRPDQRWQWCSNNVATNIDWIDCKHCRKLAEKWVDGSL